MLLDIVQLSYMTYNLEVLHNADNLFITLFVPNPINKILFLIYFKQDIIMLLL